MLATLECHETLANWPVKKVSGPTREIPHKRASFSQSALFLVSERPSLLFGMKVPLQREWD